MILLARCAPLVLAPMLAPDLPATSANPGTASLTTGQGTDGCATPTPIAGTGPFPFDCVAATPCGDSSATINLSNAVRAHWGP